MKREEEEEYDHRSAKKRKEEYDHKSSRSSSEDIPLDLTVEILKKLPAKSLVRFHCVSKQWSSIIGYRKDFIDSIITRSLAQPPRDRDLHYIFEVYSPEPSFFLFFSSSYTHNHKEQSVPIPKQCQRQHGWFEYQYVRGLICCCWLNSPDLVMIYNPTTRQSLLLPEMESPRKPIDYCCFFGYDSVMNQYKIMCMTKTLEESYVYKVFTLGDPMKRWRNIESIGNHVPLYRGVHIDGTFYYGARAEALVCLDNTTYNTGEAMFLGFAFRSERFNHINAPKVVTIGHRRPTLVNYKGKLGWLCSNNGAEMWVMDDVENQKWSKTVFWLPDIPLEGLQLCHRFSGVTLSGEIFILQLYYHPNDGPSYVYFYHPTKNSFTRVEIQGTSRHNISDYICIVGVPDHVENVMCLD